MKKEQNKKIIKIGTIIIVVIMIFIVVITTLSKPEVKSNTEQDIKEQLTKIGKKFYEDYYYGQIGQSDEERIEMLEKLEKSGIRVDLENLAKYNDEKYKADVEKLKNNEKDQKCNKKITKIIIYPKSPYGKKDYEINTEIDCGF